MSTKAEITLKSFYFTCNDGINKVCIMENENTRNQLEVDPAYWIQW